MRARLAHARLGDFQIEVRAGGAFDQRIQLRIVEIFPPGGGFGGGIGFAAGEGFAPVRRGLGLRLVIVGPDAGEVGAAAGQKGQRCHG
jgi:hypothetical protein